MKQLNKFEAARYTGYNSITSPKWKSFLPLSSKAANTHERLEGELFTWGKGSDGQLGH